MRYVITGSNEDIFDLPKELSYCWENYFRLFEPGQSRGKYVGRETVFKNHEMFDHIDLWIVEVGQWYRKPDYLNAVEAAHKADCMAVACIHSPHVMLVGGFYDYMQYNFQNLSAFDGLILHYPDEAFALYFEQLLGVPTIPILPPPQPEIITGVYEVKETLLPFSSGTYCFSANPLFEDLDRRADLLYHACMEHEIPVLVNLPPNKSERSYHYFEFLQRVYGKDIALLDRLSLPEYYYVLEHAAFVSVASMLPTLGKPVLDAAMCKTLSISVKSGWQQYLYPETTVTYDAQSLISDIPITLRAAERYIESARDRLISYDLPGEQARFRDWLESL